MKLRLCGIIILCCIVITWLMTGCAGKEHVPNRPVMYFHKELAAADRAVEAAREAGKDKECPERFKAAEKTKNDAFDIYLSCLTEEGIAKANDAARMANALCLNSEPKVQTSAPGSVHDAAVASTQATASASAPGSSLKQAKEAVSLKVEFDFDKSDVKPGYHEEIARFAARMKKNPEAKATIEGHTDDIGGVEYNQKLSERRVASVKRYLVEKFGIAASRITKKGYGKSKPVADNRTEEGRQRNRRVVEAILR